MADENPSDDSITEEGYDLLAADADRLERWESPWADSHYQRYYVWPAVQSLLPDVADLTVLDAGCGVGQYAQWFLEQGASVVGVDASTEALAAARSRCGDDATFYRHDLTDSFEFAADDAFDLVFSNLVLDHIEDWRPVVAEFARVLKPNGTVVVTTIHPFRRYLNHRDELTSYYDTEGYAVEWGSTDARIESYYRPIGDIINSFATTGFSITEFREARPQDEYAEHQPDRYERATTGPDTLCIRARLIENPTGTDRPEDG